MDTSKIRILLIDDDEEEYVIVRKYLKRTRSGPYEVKWAPTFEKALDAIVASKFDLCLLDYNLGERTGVELLDEMRSHGIDLPVILLTGQASFEMDLNAMEKGVSDFLEKDDLTPVLLERSIRYAIENHRGRAELQRMNEELEERVRERTAELNRSNQGLEQFANMVASDLQEPLRVLSAHIERIRARETEVEAGNSHVAHRLLDPILHATRNLELMVQIVLDYSRAGRDPERFKAVDLSQVVQDVCADHEDAAMRLGATIEVGPLPKVLGDERQLKGLFENLLDNALKYRGPDAPHIRISAERKEEHWGIAVRDNGIGVEEEDSKDIFLMFTRVARDSAYEGAGIGLAMCRKIVQYHGGRIWVDSEFGQGSTFHVLLPAEG